MRLFQLCLFAVLTCLTTLAAYAGPPELLLDVARFRNLDKVKKGAVVEIYVTVPTQPLTYRQRAPRMFQSAATVTMEVLDGQGKSAYRETITLKPPVLSDTTISLKNPQSFLKRVYLPDGTYTLRGTVRDLYRKENGETVVERPLVLGASEKGAYLSDIVLLSRPAAKSYGDDNFHRGGFELTRAAGGFYGRGAETIYFYTEVHQAKPGETLRLHYHLEAPDGSAADADAQLTTQEGKPTTVVGQLPMGPLPDGPLKLTITAYGGAGGKQKLTTQTVTAQRNQTEFAPTGAALPRE